MENVFLKPARIDGKAVIVPDEVTHRPLKEEGEWKPLTSYWARRLRDQDAIESEPDKEPVAKQSSKTISAPPVKALRDIDPD